MKQILFQKVHFSDILHGPVISIHVGVYPFFNVFLKMFVFVFLLPTSFLSVHDLVLLIFIKITY